MARSRTSWPAYYENRTPMRVYAYDRGDGEIITEHGELIHYDTWDDLTRIIRTNMVLLTEDLVKYLELGCVKDPGVTVLASERGHITAITKRYSTHERRTIVPIGTWTDFLEEEVIFHIRMLMYHCQVGDRATPSALGQALARKIWQGKNLKWHWPVPEALQAMLKDYASGARTECPGMGWHGEEAWEYDITSAYPNHSRVLPAGSVISIDDYDYDWYSDFPTWFRYCLVRNTEHMKITPVSKPPGSGYSDPLLKGSFTTWLWKEQADAARELGISVYPRCGWAWPEMTTDNSHAIDHMLKLRETCPQYLLGYLKKSTLAYLGRFSMQSDMYKVTDFYEEGEWCKPVFDRNWEWAGRDSPHSGYYIVLHSKSKGSMIHWHRYTIMQTNQTLYRIGLHHANKLLAFNFDSILLPHRIEIPKGWKEQHLTNVTIPYSRGLISDQKVRLPGVRR